VTHFHLASRRCRHCGKMRKALIPPEHRTGFGPRLSSIIAVMAGTQADSRRAIQDFFFSVLGLHVSQGAIQKILDRVSRAIDPHYQAIGALVRRSPVNHVDETAWYCRGMLQWLWVMEIACSVFHDSPTSVEEGFPGIDPGLARHSGQRWLWRLREMGGAASNLSGASDPPRQRACGAKRPRDRQMWHLDPQGIAEVVPHGQSAATVGEWNMFYARFIRLVSKYSARTDDARQTDPSPHRRNGSSVAVSQGSRCCPDEQSRRTLLRFAVLWRKASFGTVSEKGGRFAERILSLRQTCDCGEENISSSRRRHDCLLRWYQSETAWIQEVKN
jgi:transposase